MPRPWSIPAVNLSSRQLKWVGNKAARLGDLKRNGVPVPEFHVLPVYTCQKYLQNRDDDSRSDLKQKLAPIINSFTAQNTHSRSIAVRSSARAEDSLRYSFAGQFQSFLNLSEPDQIVDALYAVFQSASALSLQHYPGKSSNHANAMAVILQSMVQPIFSGVLFTKNPLRAGREMLIEYVAASNEQLMQGSMEPFRIRLDRAIQRTDALGPSGPLSKPAYQALLSELARIAEKIEALNREPQDIEWAIDADHRLWILQTRPITAAARSSHIHFDGFGREYTSYFFSERFSTPMSPMGWSLIGKLIEKNAFRDPLWFLGEDFLAKAPQIVNLFCGYPAVRLHVIQKIYSVIPPRFVSQDKKAELLLDRLSYVWWRNLLAALPYLFTRLLCKNLDWLPFFHLHKWRVFNNTCLSQLKAINKVLCTISPDMGRLHLLDQTIGLSDQFLSLHRWSITFADLYYELLLKYVTFFIDKVNGVDLTHKLLTGIANNQTVLANQRLAELAKGFDDVKLERAAWDEYFSAYGHRCESLDISMPTWAESRESMMAFARQIRISGNDTHTGLPFAQKEREAAEQKCRTLLRKRWGRIHSAIFSYLLTRAQNFTLLRENQRDLWHRILAASRQLLLQMAEQMVEQGVLQQPNDIFYLTCSELTQQLQGRWDLETRINNRKKTYAAWSHVITQDPGLPTDIKTRTLAGVAVSQGRVEGFAHIAGSYEEALSAKKDAILVAHCIDPAWTPVFHLVSGLILEVGGVLSHASILAREFGVPAVTSVHNATHVIKQGQHIVLDGTIGFVYLDKEQS